MGKLFFIPPVAEQKYGSTGKKRQQKADNDELFERQRIFMLQGNNHHSVTLLQNMRWNRETLLPLAFEYRSGTVTANGKNHRKIMNFAVRKL